MPAPAPSPARDPWFWSHYWSAATAVKDWVPPAWLAQGKCVVDFGCGDGATALGVASRARATVCGVDLCESYHALPRLARDNLGLESLPSNLSFRQNVLGERLPLADESADLVYSWSVFEHLADVTGTLDEFRRIVRRDGGIFIQVEPLFFGPFGSHLQRLVDEPWAHLMHDEEAFLRRAAAAQDHVPEAQKDVLYRTHAFEELKRHLLREYRNLNRITAERLLAHVAESGFRIERSVILPPDGLMPPPDLVCKYPAELLMANQVVLLAVKR